MQFTEASLQTTVGEFAMIDYGGSGPDCLLIHGTGQNALAWRQVAELLSHRFRVMAFDMRGHGQTLLDSSDAEQYWRDIGPVLAAARMEQPLLIGHSTGAYAAMAYAASGGEASAIVCVDGFTLDTGDANSPLTEEDWQATQRQFFDLFRYGWRTSRTDRDKYIEKVVNSADGDPFNTGIEPAQLRDMLERCFVEKNGGWLRRPTFDEIRTVSLPDANSRIRPDRTIYDQVDVPMLLIWAQHGLSADRLQDLKSRVAGSRNRMLATIDASHNVPMQKPAELVRLISDYWWRDLRR
ncbi:alpha/beta fold hydrolase [Falsochrobactrum shanghaiense]|nr:alpha/beta hydrolase [Falsochrobactrum shanghaiense]